MLLLQGKYVVAILLDIIVPVSSTKFQPYDITSCDHSHMPFH